MNEAAWVIGASGLLGRAVSRALRADPHVTLVIAEALDWDNKVVFDRRAIRAIRELTAIADGNWTIYWCAGAGVVGTDQGAFDAELDRFRSFLYLLGSQLSQAASSRGALFFASSAGGVYAGSAGSPFSENTVAIPISPYGRTKLAAEEILIDFAAAKIPVLVGRIANLYGPDQNLEKAQGIISQLCKSSIGGPPTSIYVSLDTLRDYIFADDCAALVLDSIARFRLEHAAGAPPFAMKIIASQQAVTLGAILGMVRSIFKRAPNARIGSSPNSAWQVRDLRFASAVWPDLDQRNLTPLPVGVHAVARAMMLSREYRRA